MFHVEHIRKDVHGSKVRRIKKPRTGIKNKKIFSLEM
jgi:hypothetical protein